MYSAIFNNLCEQKSGVVSALISTWGCGGAVTGNAQTDDRLSMAVIRTEYISDACDLDICMAICVEVRSSKKSMGYRMLFFLQFRV